MEIKKALIVGLGSIGIRHLTMFNTVFPASVEIGVLRRSKERPFKFVRNYFTSEHDAINWKPDIVIIASPSNTHAHFTSAFRGCHILLEKPAVLNEQQLKVLSETPDKNLIQVGYNYRYHPVFLDLKDYLNSNKIKSIRLLHSDYLPNWHPWEDYRDSDLARDGVGLTLCHGIDLILELFKDVDVLNLKKECSKNLDIQSFSVFKGTCISEKTNIDWEIRVDDPKVNHFKFEVTDQMNKTLTFDMNTKKHTRNDTFISQIRDFKNKITTQKNFKNDNRKAFLRAKRIVEICQ